jgi:hypothetical protein
MLVARAIAPIAASNMLNALLPSTGMSSVSFVV